MEARYVRLIREHEHYTYFKVVGDLYTCTHGGWSGYAKVSVNGLFALYHTESRRHANLIAEFLDYENFESKADYHKSYKAHNGCLPRE